MNERIKELAKQAGYNPFWSTKADKEQFFDLEEFAELIVRECVGCIDDGRGEASSMAEHGWRQVCQKEIKKHFGVE